MSEAPVQCRDLGRRFGEFEAVRHLSLELHPGEVFGFLGSNGAGKSTTIRMLCGLLAPTSGEALVAGHDVRKAPEKVKERIGYMSQRFSLYQDLTVEENLAFFGGAYGLSGEALRRRIDQTVEEAGLQEDRRSRVGTMPAGRRQRVALANALLHDPAVLFLDEPTAGVDPSARQQFMAIVRERARRGTTIFLTTHYLDEAEYCHRVGLMVRGTLVALDTPDALKALHAPGQWRVLRGPPGPLWEVLGRLPGVRSRQRVGGGVRACLDPEEEERVVASVRQAVPGTEVEVSEPSLEDVFLALHHREAP